MSRLFSPLTIKEVTFKNRIFVSPMCHQYSCENGMPYLRIERCALNIENWAIRSTAAFWPTARLNDRRCLN